MPPQMAPTYRLLIADDIRTFTCLVPDANSPEGICGHQSTDFDYFMSHMHTRHAGILIQEPAPEEDQEAAAASSEPETPPAGSSTAAARDDREE